MSNRPRLVRAGTIRIDSDGKVSILDFRTANADCAEHCQLAMSWAMEKLAIALRENMSADAPKLSGYGGIE